MNKAELDILLMRMDVIELVVDRVAADLVVIGEIGGPMDCGRIPCICANKYLDPGGPLSLKGGDAK